jgi:hypothetical protein
MSQAFLRDDAEGEMPRRNYDLPPRDDPEFDRLAARALLEAARVSETQLAERATGYYWGEPRLRPHVEAMLAEAERAKDDRLEQLARRLSGMTFAMSQYTNGTSRLRVAMNCRYGSPMTARRARSSTFIR